MTSLGPFALALPLVLLLQASPTPIPERPEALPFDTLPFRLPTAAGLEHRLGNGMRVVVVEDSALPLVDVVVALPVGDYLDTAERPGVASLTAALLRRGGGGDLDADAFDEAVDALGAELNSVGGGRRSGVSLDCTTATLDRALPLLAAILRQPRFQADRLAQLRENLLESLAGRSDDPLRLLDREWRWLISGREHFEARQLTAAQAAAIERQDLFDFYRRYWRPEWMVIAVSGDVVAKEIVARLESLLGDWRSPERKPPPSVSAERRPAKPGLYHLEAATPQAKVALGHSGAALNNWDEPDSWALQVMSEVLGGSGAVSRLRSRLRAEERLVYRVSLHFGIGRKTPGEFQIFFETDPAGVAPALRAAVDELRRISRQPVPEAELELAKASLLDAFPLAFDSTAEIAGRYAEDLLLGRPHEYWQRYRERIARVGSEDVRRVARRYLEPERLRILVVGPWAEIAAGQRGRELERLARGKVTRLPRRNPLTLEAHK